MLFALIDIYHQSQVLVAYTCNASYLWGWDAEDWGLRPVQPNSSWATISKITRAKWTRGVAQMVECLLCNCKAKSSNPRPTKKEISKNILCLLGSSCDKRGLNLQKARGRQMCSLLYANSLKCHKKPDSKRGSTTSWVCFLGHLFNLWSLSYHIYKNGDKQNCWLHPEWPWGLCSCITSNMVLGRQWVFKAAVHGLVFTHFFWEFWW
jgi:hypothetical protein